MRRVLRIVTRLNVGGPSRQVLPLTRVLQERGWDCVLAAGTGPVWEGAAKDMADAESIQVRSVVPLVAHPAPVKDVRAVKALRRLMEEVRPDVVHTHTAKAGELGWRALMGLPRPRPKLVHTFHGTSWQGRLGRVGGAWLRRLERRRRLGTDAIVAVSEAVAVQVEQAGIARAGQVHVHPPGLRLDHFAMSASCADAGRQLLGRAGLLQGPVVVGGGRLVGVKDPLLFVDAAALLGDTGAVFAWMGDGPLRAAVLHRARRLGLGPERFAVLGWVDRPETVMCASDTLLVTSRSEGWPLLVIEARRTGLSVVGTPVGGMHEALEGRGGWVAPSRRAGDLARLVRCALFERPAREERGRFGLRQSFVHSPDLLADRTEGLYEMLLEGVA